LSLNDQDEQWTKLRSQHFLEAYQQVNQEVSNIVQSSQTLKSTDEMNVTDMAEMLKSMPKQEEMVKNYKVHIDLLKKVTTAAGERRLAKLVELEQMIISGKEKTSKANNTAIVKAIS
jgi:hypothetical protein